MKFQVNVGEFKKVLKPIIVVANTFKDRNLKGMIWLKSSEDELSIYTGSEFVKLSSELVVNKNKRLNYQCQDPGCVYIKGKSFLGSLAFPPEQTVEIYIPDNSLYISPLGDHSEYQTVPLQMPDIKYKPSCEQRIKGYQIHRNILLKGLRKVKFAMHPDHTKPEYDNLVVDVSKNKMRFIAGCGPSFAVYEIKAKSLSDCKKSTRISLPSHCINNLITLLSNSKQSKVSVIDKSKHNKILIVEGNMTLEINNIFTGDYAPIDNILNYNHPYHITSKFSKWKRAVKSILATYTLKMQKDLDIHVVDIEVDLEKGWFKLEAGEEMQAKTYVEFTPNSFFEQGYESTLLRCRSCYFEDMVKFGNGEEVIFRFKDQDSPIVIDFPEIENKRLGLKEKSCMFFTTTNKKRLCQKDSSPPEYYECSMKAGITKTPEFEKKGLAGFAINVGTKCDNDCMYCSTGSILWRHQSFKDAGKDPLGFGYAIIDTEKPDKVAADAKRIRKRGMVELCTTTDAWAPSARSLNLGRRCLEAVLNEPDWTVRILTKNHQVENDFDLIKKYRDRVVVGLSITAPAEKSEIMQKIETNASSIEERIRVMHKAKEEGLRTYAMFCPILPVIADSPEQIDSYVQLAESFGAEEIFTESVNARSRSLILTQQALEQAGYLDEAKAVASIRNHKNWAEYTVRLIKNFQRSVRKYSDISKLRVLLYPSYLLPEHIQSLKEDNEGIVWLKKPQKSKKAKPKSNKTTQ